jgi:phenylacetate-CoA ligase
MTVARAAQGEAATDLRRRWRELVQEHVCHYDAPGSDRYWCPELETASRDRLREIQDPKVALAYRQLFECSPFYRRKLEGAGLGPDDVSGVADLVKVPPTFREEWLEDQEAHPPWGTFSPLRQEDWLERGWMLFTTSGTTAAMPRVFRHTTFDRDLWLWHGARALYAMGVRQGDIALNCFGYGTSVAFWGLHYALNHMGVPIIPGGGSNTERRAFFIDSYKPTVLIGTPSYVLYLGRVMEESGMDPRASSVRLLVTAGEPGACVPSTKARIEDLWGARVHDDFGCTEVAMSPMGYTCSYQVEKDDGQAVDVHLMEDSFVVEVLHPETLEPLPDGERGILVVSNLFSEAQPILRYVMGDWITVTRERCPCGRTHARAVGGLQGRNDQLIKIRGLLFFPAVIEDSVRSLSELGDEFKVEILREGDLDRVKVTAEPAPDAGADGGPSAEQVARRLKGSLGIDVEVEMVPHGTLPRTTFKAKRLFDLRGAAT